MSERDAVPDRRSFIRMLLTGAAGASVGSLLAFGGSEATEFPTGLDALDRFDWGFVVDTNRCIGCGACVRACKTENKVPDGYFRTWVERFEIDADENVHVDSPDGALHGFVSNRSTGVRIVKGFFVPKLCNHCKNSSCTQVCPVGATFHTPDGVVLVDRRRCIGCGYCVQACPYGTRYVYHPLGTADKCTLCYHRIHKGRTTACVQACPREARLCGDLKNPRSRIRTVLHERRYGLLKPELGTNPKCYYVGLDIEVK